MRKPSLLLLICCSIFIIACSTDSQQQKAEKATLTSNNSPSSPDYVTNQGICLWSKVGLRDKPGVGNDVAYLTTIFFGETVELLDSNKVEVDSKEYINVKLSDGQEGWVNEYLFATEAVLGVSTRPIDIYRRPDIMTFKDEQLERGEIVAILNSESQEWKEIMTRERTNDGWVKMDDGISTDKTDVKLAALFQKAMSEDELKNRIEQLKLITDNPSFNTSAFLDMVNNALTSTEEKMQALANIADNQLYITAQKLNVRNSPKMNDENIAFQVKKGDICYIKRKGGQEIVNDINDFWYKIEYEGQSGWVFGHYTSKKLQAVN